MTAQDAYHSAPAKIEIAAETSGGAGVSLTEAFSGSMNLGEAKSGTLGYAWSGVPAGAHLVSMRVTDKSGAVASSPSVLVRVGEVGFHRAINFNGPPVTIDGNAWEGRDAPNLSKKGNGFEMQDVELKLPTDAERAQMIRSSISSAEGTSVTLSAVPNGPYLIYLYVWHESEPNTFDVLVKCRIAHSGYTSAPGRWDRLGPWPVEVADGTIEVKASRAGAHFSGIEVWRVGPPPPPSVPAQTALVGGTGGNLFEDAPAERPFLVGVRITTFLFNKKDLIVKTMQPLFQKGEARTDGSIHGNPGPGAVDIMARPGYAIGGMIAKASNRVHGFKIVFMKISGARLVPTDRYESEWIGGTGGWKGHIDHLTLGGGKNGAILLNALTLIGDNDVDILRGGTGKDWFIAHTTGGGVANDILDVEKGEIVTNV